MAQLIFVCQFRHDPMSDGTLIPASEEVVDPRRVNRDDYDPEADVMVAPIVGYYLARLGKRDFWGFVKYEAPEGDDPRRHLPNRPATFSTTRVAHVQCPDCGFKGLWPAAPKPQPGKPSRAFCPGCGGRRVTETLVDEGSPEYFSMLGALRSEMENAAAEVAADPASAPEFRYPELMLLGHLAPDPDVPPAWQGLAQAKGLGLILGRNTSLDVLFGREMDGPETGLAIAPGPAAGVLDSDLCREGGWRIEEGVVRESVRLPFLPKPPPPRHHFGGARI